MTAPGLYTVESATRFGWGSAAAELPPERVELLARHVVGTRVLDAGCGGGGYVDLLARKGLDAVGVDKFDFYLGLAAERNLRGSFLQADLTEGLPFPDKHFDTAFSFDVFEHVDDEAAVRELARVTRRRLLVIVPQEDTALRHFGMTLGPYRDPTHLRYYTADRLHALAAAVGGTAVVFPESRVPLPQLASTHLRVRSRWPGVGRGYTTALRFLLRRAVADRLFQNLAAVIDLPA